MHLPGKDCSGASPIYNGAATDTTPVSTSVPTENVTSPFTVHVAILPVKITHYVTGSPFGSISRTSAFPVPAPRL